MAITKLLRIKESKSNRDVSSGLKKCINYICNPEKTNNYRNISGNAGGVPEFIYGEMKENKISWNKEHGTQGFHYVISFSPDEEVTADVALQVATEFCQTLLNDEHIYVCAAHNDTDHMHVHICFDSVNFKTGKMFHSSKLDWQKRIQPITDMVSQKYGLSVLTYDKCKERKGGFHQDIEDAKIEGAKDYISWNDIMRSDIDLCLASSKSWTEFLSNLSALQYEYKDNVYLSLRPYGKENFTRSVRLGDDYSKESLQKRIGTIKQQKIFYNSVPIYYYVRNNSKTASPFQMLFLRRWYFLSDVKKISSIPKWKLNKELTQINRLSLETKYLFDNDITTADEINSRLSELSKHRGTDAAKERKLCYGILEDYKKMLEPDELTKLTERITLPNKIYQVHINKVLFVSSDLTNETFTVKIPKSETYVNLYSADSVSYNNGEAISTYIYPEAEYALENYDGHFIGTMRGDELKDKFKNKEIERKETQWKKI